MSMRNYLRPENRWIGPIKQHLLQKKNYYCSSNLSDFEDLAMSGIIQMSIEFEDRYQAACLEAENAKDEYLLANTSHNSILSILIRLPPKLLGWISVYTASEKEVEIYFVRHNTLAPIVGGYLQTKFERY